MNPRIFSAKINTVKSKLETSIEWVTYPSEMLQKQIIVTGVEAFLDLYRDLSAADLGLQPGQTKKKWLTNMMESELDEVLQGKLQLATISIEGRLAGIIICAPTKARHENFKDDAYIAILAVKPFRDFKTGEKIRVGLGQQLIDAAITHFEDANSFTLDTRLINTAAMAFYTKLGFNCTGRRTFTDLNPDYYTGFEKSVMRKI